MGEQKYTGPISNSIMADPTPTPERPEQDEAVRLLVSACNYVIDTWADEDLHGHSDAIDRLHAAIRALATERPEQDEAVRGDCTTPKWCAENGCQHTAGPIERLRMEAWLDSEMGFLVVPLQDAAREINAALATPPPAAPCTATEPHGECRYANGERGEWRCYRAAPAAPPALDVDWYQATVIVIGEQDANLIAEELATPPPAAPPALDDLADELVFAEAMIEEGQKRLRKVLSTWTALSPGESDV